MLAALHPPTRRSTRAAALAAAVAAAILAGIWVGRVADPPRTVHVAATGILSERLATLDHLRVTTRAALRRARSSDAQARLAVRLARAHLATADALTGAADAPLVRALARTGAAYSALARAARDGSAAAFATARRDVRAAEADLARATPREQTRTVTASSAPPTPLLLVPALAFLGAAALLGRRRPMATRPAAPAPTTASPPEPAPAPRRPPAPPVLPPAAVEMPAVSSEKPVVPPMRRATPPEMPATPASMPAVPPEIPAAAPPERPAEPPETPEAHWICAVDWRAGLRSAAFRAMASAPGENDLPIAQSVQLDWPPGLPPAPTPEVRDALQTLARRLTRSGWEPIEPGGEWYARRFAWRHADEPEPLGTVTAPEPGWTCEIGWRASLRGAAFLAVATSAEEPDRVLARSAKVDSPPLLPPDPVPELVAALDALERSLLEAGWTASGCGPSWYARRFSWSHPGAPEPLGAPAAAVSGAS
jgi:hypothetical protein